MSRPVCSTECPSVLNIGDVEANVCWKSEATQTLSLDDTLQQTNKKRRTTYSKTTDVDGYTFLQIAHKPAETWGQRSQQIVWTPIRTEAIANHKLTFANHQLEI